MKTISSPHYLLSATLERSKLADKWDEYPFQLPVVQHLKKLEFHPKVTFIVGENGSGKSTLLEALAIGMGFNPEGGSRNLRFATNDTHSNLHDYLTLQKGVRRPRDGYFLRAESFYNVATELGRIEVDDTLHAQSHGESFLSLIGRRFGGKGLYILDEPEAALSPSRELTVLAQMHQLVADDSQFIIATHSPILMGYPDAIIYSIGEHGLQQIAYDDSEHVQLTRQFMEDREGILRRVLGD